MEIYNKNILNTPKVTIIIPIFNVEKYLHNCVESILNQSLKDIEIILVDDESPDNCPIICDEFASKDSRVKVIHKKNGGLGFARNSGLELATGEYVTFCDSDDWLESDALKTVYDICIKECLDICCYQFRRINNTGHILEQSNVIEENFFNPKDIKRFHLGMLGYDPENNIKNYGMSSCMALFKRTTIINSGQRFPSERDIASEDLIFMANFVPYCKKIKIIPDIFYNYRINPQSISQNFNDVKKSRILNMLYELEKIYSKKYPFNIYKNNFYSQILRAYKIIIKNTSKMKNNNLNKIKEIKSDINNPFLDTFFKDNVIHKYPFLDRIFIYLMKYKCPYILFLISKTR